MDLRGFPIIVSSPSGGGKTTVCKRVLAEDESVERVVTATTRAPRKDEVDGVDYHFWPEARFIQSVKAGLMAEWAKVHVNYYGIPKKSLDSIIRRGKNPLLVIDVQGAETVSKYYTDAVKIFLLPPSWDVLKSRLLARKDDTRDMAVRFETAKKELERIGDYYYVVVNDDLDAAVSQIKSIITAERIKTARQMPRLKRSVKGVYRFI